MTQNQINFAKLREDQRHNLATEGYTGIELQEAQRHNLVSEGVSQYGASEQARHNLAQESLNWYSAQNLGDLQHWQGQQAQSQAALNDARSIIEMAEYELDDWFKRQQIDVQSVDAATRERTQRDATRKLNAEIENIMRRLNMEEDKFKLVKSQIVSEIVRNYMTGGKTIGELAEVIAALVG